MDYGAGEDADLVAGEFAGIKREASRSGGRGTEQEVATSEADLLLCYTVIGEISSHSP